MASGAKFDWDTLDLSTPEKLHEFALYLEEGGQQAVAKAIADHKAAGNPVYFQYPAADGVLVKEMPDGRRFRIEVNADGTETLLDTLPPA